MVTNTQGITIKNIRTYINPDKKPDGSGGASGGDYHDVAAGHWLIDSKFSTPMSRYPEHSKSRVDFGINVLGSCHVEIEASDGTVGFATGLGGEPACFLIQKHFRRFLIGSDPRDINRLWDQMYRASLFYGRKGLPVAAISAVDLALWDLLGKLRNEPVYKLIGGAVKDEISFYCTGVNPLAAKKLGFWGAKVPLPYGPDDGHEGLRKNVKFLESHRSQVGDDFPLMVDCWMSLTVPYTIELANATKHLNLNWLEETLSPDETADSYTRMKQAIPFVKLTTGEHEYTRYGFRDLITSRSVDIIQPDVMWVGGLTELLRVSAMASAYDIPVVPHASGAYSYHFMVSQPNTPFQEYLSTAPNADKVLPVFGDLFVDEVIPHNGKIRVSDMNKPGFGLTRNDKVQLQEVRY
ncbi:hypothetical protein TRVA0_014S02982 [Trichomonascus vanleenenianus]|uniref:uncharacterized protein n=1 Tax=Trichomonascus vanleenenianus TaxID=2268995 RepID=UPI003ECA88F9